MSRRPSTRPGGAAILGLSATLLASCSTPLHLWDAHITSTPRATSLDVSALEREPVATLGLVAPAGLQGLSASVGHALAAALKDVSPPLRAVPIYETMSRLNEQGLAAEYADLVSGFARSGILARERLGRIGSALGARYVLQPGLGAFSETLADPGQSAGGPDDVAILVRSLIVRAGPSGRRPGFQARRSRLPRRLIPRVPTRMASPGNVAIHQDVVR
jgi:hypothetical protein